MDSSNIALVVLIAICGLRTSTANIVRKEMVLHERLFENYNRNIVPRYNRSTPLQIFINCFLDEIVYLHETENSLRLHATFGIGWTDELLRWNVTEYDEIKYIHVPVDDVWLPDIILSNGMGESKQLPNTLQFVMVFHNGTVFWWPGGQLDTKCQVNISKYPFDRQECSLFLRPWISGAWEQVFRPSTLNQDSLASFNQHSQWKVEKVENKFEMAGTLHRSISYYRFVIHLRRRSLYYIINLVLPVVILSLINLCCFIIPANSGEKLTLSVSIFLTFAVYITIINDEIPKSSTEISYFGLFLFLQLSLSGLVIVLESFILYVHHKETSGTNHYFLCCKRRTPNSQRSHVNGGTECGTIDDINGDTTRTVAERFDAIFLKVLICLDILSVVSLIILYLV